MPSLNAHPFPDESLIGFIFRLAKRRGDTSGRRLALRLGFRHLTNRPYPEWVEALAADARLPASEIWAIANGSIDDRFGNFRGVPLPTGYFDRRDFNRLGSDFRVCPDCLVENLYHRAIWDLLFIAICPVHDKVLIDTCRECGQPLRFLGVDMFLCQCGKGRLDRMSTPQVDHADARGTRVVYGLLGDGRFSADANHARKLASFADLDASDIIQFLYRVGLQTVAPERAVFSVRDAGELTRDAHVVLTRALAVAEEWPTAFFRMLDDLRRPHPEGTAFALRMSAGRVEDWLDGLRPGTGCAIRAAVTDYRRRMTERDDGQVPTP